MLTKIERRYCPLDGSWFKTTANLNSLLRAASNYDDQLSWPSFVNEVVVPIYVRMEKYFAMELPERPDGMVYGPVVRIGTMSSPEIKFHGFHWSAGLTRDYNLDPFDNDGSKYLYYPAEGWPTHGNQRGKESSIYRCDKCNQDLYRDKMGRRRDRSACMFGGGLVCRDCEVTGLVYDQEVADRLERCRSLADHVGADCRKGFERQLTYFSDNRTATETRNGSQARLYPDGKWSFGFGVSVFTSEGKKRGLNGGLIQHGPAPILNDDGSYSFKTWDYKENKGRDATPEEISGIHWSIHT